MATTIADYKKAYAAAQAKNDTAGMATAHAGAETIRNQSGYTGGENGSQMTYVGKPNEYGSGNGGVQNTQPTFSMPTYQKPAYSGIDYQSAYSQAAAQLDPAVQLLKQRTEAANAIEKAKLPEYLNARGARIIGENNLYNKQAENLSNIDLQNNAEVATLAQTLQDRSQARADTQSAQYYNQYSDSANRTMQLYQSQLGQSNADRSFNYGVDQDARNYSLDVQQAAQDYMLAQEAAQSKAEQQAIDNEFKQKGYDLNALQTQYNISKPYYNPSSGSPGGVGSKPTQTEKNQSINQQAITWVGTNKGKFTGKQPAANMYSQVRRNMEAGTMDATLGNAILAYLAKNYTE